MRCVSRAAMLQLAVQDPYMVECLLPYHRLDLAMRPAELRDHHRERVGGSSIEGLRVWSKNKLNESVKLSAASGVSYTSWEKDEERHDAGDWVRGQIFREFMVSLNGALNIPIFNPFLSDSWGHCHCCWWSNLSLYPCCQFGADDGVALRSCGLEEVAEVALLLKARRLSLQGKEDTDRFMPC